MSRGLRYKDKNAVDTAVWRAGDVVSALSVNGLKAMGVGTAGFGIFGAVLLGTGGIIGWRLARWVERRDVAVACDARARSTRTFDALR